MPKRSKKAAVVLPAANDWRTTDHDEVERRKQRAREESFAISNVDARHPVFSNFRVRSNSGLTYLVEIRCVRTRQFSCDCVDFRINGLGTCKHAEAVLLQVQRRFRRPFAEAAQGDSDRIDVVPDAAGDTLRIAHANGHMGGELLEWFTDEGTLRNGSPEAAVAALEELQRADWPQIRISQEVRPWLENRARGFRDLVAGD